MGNGTAGAKDAGLLLLIEMGRVYTYNVLSFVAHTASSAPPESSPSLACNSPKGQDATQTPNCFLTALALPKRHK